MAVAPGQYASMPTPPGGSRTRIVAAGHQVAAGQGLWWHGCTACIHAHATPAEAVCSPACRALEAGSQALILAGQSRSLLGADPILGHQDQPTRCRTSSPTIKTSPLQLSRPAHCLRRPNPRTLSRLVCPGLAGTFTRLASGDGKKETKEETRESTHIYSIKTQFLLTQGLRAFGMGG
jgi:hypothetical protein